MSRLRELREKARQQTGKKQKASPPPPPTDGAGSELHRLLAEKGFHVSTNCGCISMMHKMNRWSIDENLAHIDEIANVMVREMYRRHITILGLSPPEKLAKLQAKRWAKQAIRRWKAKKEQAHPPPEKLIIFCTLCPGDVMTLTAAIESLHRTYPNEYQTDVRTSCDAIFQHNPYITSLPDNDLYTTRLNLDYSLIHRSNQQMVSFLSGYTHNLGERLGRPLSLVVNRPCLYLSNEERMTTSLIEQFKHKPLWLLNAGIKSDFTNKAWPIEYYEEVVAATPKIKWVQIGALEHDHPEIKGSIDLRGKTTHRQLIRLSWYCNGGLGPVTYLQHLCAAWEKPYICLLGGREPVSWVQYPLQHTLHTIGSMDCCRQGACWRSRVVRLQDQKEWDKSLCEHPVDSFSRPVAECMSRIKPSSVIDIIERLL